MDNEYTTLKARLKKAKTESTRDKIKDEILEHFNLGVQNLKELETVDDFLAVVEALGPEHSFYGMFKELGKREYYSMCNELFEELSGDLACDFPRYVYNFESLQQYLWLTELWDRIITKNDDEALMELYRYYEEGQNYGDPCKSLVDMLWCLYHAWFLGNDEAGGILVQYNNEYIGCNNKGIDKGKKFDDWTPAPPMEIE